MTGDTTDETCLHLVVSARAEALRDCLSMRTDGDTVIFIDSGVMHWCLAGAELLSPEFLFSGPDLEARGLLAMSADAERKILEDIEVAELIRHHSHCMTWK